MIKLIVAFRNFAKALKMYIDVHVKYSCYSCPILIKLEFLDKVLKILKCNSTKIRPSGADFFYADGQPDR
jgi:hypothetical protein